MELYTAIETSPVIASITVFGIFMFICTIFNDKMKR